MVNSLSLQGAAKQLAANCVLDGRSGNKVNLKLDPLGKSLLTDNLKERLGAALNQHFGEDLRLHISLAEQAEDTIVRQNNEAERQRQLEARRSIESDPQVRALQEQFGATLDPSSIKPRS
ncbi:MAG: DNA polymerase III subunit gamma/tau C-terminal domain-containing protein [Pseudomonadota bacterium]